MGRPVVTLFNFSNKAAGALLDRGRVISSLELLLDALEKERLLKFNLFLSGFALDCLQGTEMISRLVEKDAAGQVELLAGLMFEPSAYLVQPGDTKNQAELCLSFWQQHGLEPDGLLLAEDEQRYLEELSSLPLSFLVLATEHPQLLALSAGKLSLIEAPAVCNPGQGMQGLRKELAAAAEVLLLSGAETLLHLISPDDPSLLRHFLQALSDTGSTSMLLGEWANREKQDDYITPPSSVAELTGEAAFRNRLEFLRTRMKLLPQLIENNPSYFVNRERFKRTQLDFARAQYGPGPANKGTLRERYLARRNAVRYLLCAEVEADAISHPEVDPSDGWINRQHVDYDGDGEAEWIFESPFFRCCFKPSLSAAVEFNYKPRKIDLLNTALNSDGNYSFRGVITAGSEQSHLAGSRAILLRANPDIAVFRLEEKLALPGREDCYLLYKDFTVKAGLASFPAGATATFPLEYWIEETSAPTDPATFALDFCLMLPSGELGSYSARPLLCFGGEGEKAFPLLDPLEITKDKSPGGVYGVRLIDGVDNFIIDLRTTKEVAAVQLIPLTDSESGEPFCGGIQVRLISPLSSVSGDTNSNILYFTVY